MARDPNIRVECGLLLAQALQTKKGGGLRFGNNLKLVLAAFACGAQRALHHAYGN